MSHTLRCNVSWVHAFLFALYFVEVRAVEKKKILLVDRRKRVCYKLDTDTPWGYSKSRRGFDKSENTIRYK